MPPTFWVKLRGFGRFRRSLRSYNRASNWQAGAVRCHPPFGRNHGNSGAKCGWHQLARLIVGNKSDLPDCLTDSIPDSIAWFDSEAVRISARTGEGLEVLLDRISQRLVPRLPPPGQPFPVTPKQIERLEKWRNG